MTVWHYADSHVLFGRVSEVFGAGYGMGNDIIGIRYTKGIQKAILDYVYTVRLDSLYSMAVIETCAQPERRFGERYARRRHTVNVPQRMKYIILHDLR